MTDNLALSAFAHLVKTYVKEDVEGAAKYWINLIDKALTAEQTRGEARTMQRHCVGKDSYGEDLFVMGSANAIHALKTRNGAGE